MSIGKAGRASEKRVARNLGARLTPASGAVIKGDMVHRSGEHKFLIEAKSTKRGTLALDLDWLTKIVTEAMNRASVPVMALSFTDESGLHPRQNGEWMAVPAWFFKEILP